MAVKLTEKKLVTSMTADQTFVVEVGGALRRLKLGDLQKMVGNELFYPTITLEQSSNPKFDLPTPFMANMYRQQMGGYMMKTVGGVVYAAKLDAGNWDYFADGTKVDDAAKYETMVRVPDCHFKAEGKTMQFGGLFPIAGGHKFDSPNWVGAYEMFVDSSGVGHSRPGVAPSYSRTMTEFWNCAQKLGSNFGLANYGFFCLINALYQESFGNLDSQSVIGAGWQHSNFEACRNVAMGLTRSLGDATGCVLYNDSTLGNQYPTKLFGFEDLFSKLWEFRPGIRFYMRDGQRYAVIYGGNQVSNSASGREVAIPLLNSGGHTAKTMLLGEYWDMLCTSYDGDTYGGNVYYCDGHWDAEGGELLFVGGSAAYGSRCGVACSYSYFGFSLSGSYFGARLAFYGTPLLVSGTELMAM